MSSAARKKKSDTSEDKLTRIAIVSADRCRPQKCRQECKASCPVQRMGKICITIPRVAGSAGRAGAGSAMMAGAPKGKIAIISEDMWCVRRGAGGAAF